MAVPALWQEAVISVDAMSMVSEASVPRISVIRTQPRARLLAGL